jgi:hypothetical protein
MADHSEGNKFINHALKVKSMLFQGSGTQPPSENQIASLQGIPPPPLLVKQNL